MEEWGMWFRANEGRNGICGLGDNVNGGMGYVV